MTRTTRHDGAWLERLRTRLERRLTDAQRANLGPIELRSRQAYTDSWAIGLHAERLNLYVQRLTASEALRDLLAHVAQHGITSREEAAAVAQRAWDRQMEELAQDQAEREREREAMRAKVTAAPQIKAAVADRLDDLGMDWSRLTLAHVQRGAQGTYVAGCAYGPRFSHSPTIAVSTTHPDPAAEIARQIEAWAQEIHGFEQAAA